MTPEELYARWEPSALRVALGYARRLPSNIQLDDVVAAARMGLWQAITRSKEERPGFEFYLRVVVRGAIKDELRRQDWQKRRARERGDLTQIRSLDSFEIADHVRWKEALSVEPEAERLLIENEKHADLSDLFLRLPKR